MQGGFHESAREADTRVRRATHPLAADEAAEDAAFARELVAPVLLEDRRLAAGACANEGGGHGLCKSMVSDLILRLHNIDTNRKLRSWRSITLDELGADRRV